jgi:hypothetical protein
MDRRREIVQDADLVTLLEKEKASPLADEAGSAGDQDLHCPGL